MSVISRLLPAGLLAVLLISTSARGQIVISEIMYHPAGTNALEQWLELHNTGTNEINLAGWHLTHAVSFGFPTNSTSRMAPGAYLVVASDIPTFQSGHPQPLPVLGGWQGSLGHDADEVVLEDSTGAVVNRVPYASEGEWAVRRIGPPDRLKREGWEWYAEHAGQGMSLELINDRLSNQHGQNWASSLFLGGTPGAPNSAARSETAPLILNVEAFPPIPRSADPVAVTARLLDESAVSLRATLHWRTDGAPALNAQEMIDDGQHGDALVGDGIFGGIIPAQTNGTIVEFTVSSADAAGNTRSWPNVIPSGGPRTANALYQVDDSTYSGDQPMYRLILPRAEYEYLSTEIWSGEPFSDAFVSGTFVSTDGVLHDGTGVLVRQLCSFRNRGHGTRTAVPHNFHVGFPADSPWRGRSGLNLNTRSVHSQHLGSAIFRRLGMPMADSRPVQVRVNGANLAKAGPEQFGSYAANEAVDDRLVKRQFPLDPEGNLYRGVRDMIPGIRADADLAWHGDSWVAYTNAYSKENHATINDWSDLIGLLNALNNSPDEQYAQSVARVANVSEWMKYFAANTLLGNQENSLGIGSGDDFALYRGTNDTRFLLLPYDMDSLMGRGTRATNYADGLWRMTNVAAIHRFMKRPEFVPLYYRHLRDLGTTAFAPARMNPLLDQLLSGYVDAQAIANLKAFNESQVAYVLGLIPSGLTVTHSLSVTSGLPHTATSRIALNGTGDAVDTRRITVNGTPAEWIAWEGVWTNQTVELHPGVNRILVQAFNAQEVEIGRTNLDVWFDSGAPMNVAGSISADTTWTPAAGPYRVTANLTVGPGATLTLEPGTTVYLDAGVNFVVADGGRLDAEGTENAPIRFTAAPGQSGSWGGIVINGSVGSPESRMVHAHIDSNGTTAIHSTGGTLYLERLSFGTTSHPYVSLDESSFVVRDCVFPDPSAAFEPVHGTGGIKAGGHGLFLRNFFGLPIGYNDVVDFTGGNRPGGPIVQFLDNVFTGASDDALDLDGTDAWVEGNIFLHVHKNGTPDSSSAVSGGSDGSRTSEVTIIGNIFYDCDQAVTAKQGNFYVLLNNTIVRQTKVGGLDVDAAVLNLADDGTTEGAGLHLEGNIIMDAEKLLRNVTAARITLTNNLIPFAWSGSGGGNSQDAPLLRHVPDMAETVFHSWEQAQVMREWLAPGEGSPAIGTGPNGMDKGGVVPRGASVHGAPEGVTALTSATLTVGTLRAGLTVDGFPEGAGFTHYRYRLDSEVWSNERPTSTPIVVNGLSDGAHRVQVVGRRDSGMYQDDPLMGLDAVVTASQTWTVDQTHVTPTSAGIRLNEVLADSSGSGGGANPGVDLIELHNEGSIGVDLSGMGLSDNANVPRKFVFPAGTRIEAGGYLVVSADSGKGGTLLHTGFALKASGDDLYLHDKSPASTPLDSIYFGRQVEGYSLGRRVDGSWGLCRPTFGGPNVAQAIGRPERLRINEWLTDAQFVAKNDFVELYNPEPLPVALGGLFLSDAAGSPGRNAIAPLSYIAASGYASFVADSDPGQGADHLDFKLSPDVGLILLSTPELAPIDVVVYGPQRTDTAEGRSPNGGDTITRLDPPTPGGGNPGVAADQITISTETIPLLSLGANWKYVQTANLDSVPWTVPTYDDGNWSSGPGLLGVEDAALPAPGLQTRLTIGRVTYYFRTHFLVETNLDGFRLNLTMVVDDGVVLYLNGARVLADGMNQAAPVYSTTASRNVGNAVSEYFTLPASLLVPGTNYLAAEVHQTAIGSSDIVWGMAIEAARSVTNRVSGGRSPLVLNEVLAAPAEGVDFVELFNPAPEPVDLSGASLSDDLDFPRKWVFPPESRVAPGAFLVIPCNPAAAASPTNADFGLKSNGGSIFLFAAPSAGGVLIDSLRYGLQSVGCSLGRVPNGSGNWTLGSPTQGAPNNAVALGNPSVLRVNEWMANPLSGDDWFELYNSGPSPVALGGLFLTDNAANKTQSPIQGLSYIGVGSTAYVRFVADGTASAGAEHVGFSLSKSGEDLAIFSPSGVMLDGIHFLAQQAQVSEGRFPDGESGIVRFPATSSPGAANYLPLEAPIINEVLAHTDPPLEDAIELFNPAAGGVDIGGWYLSNTADELRKFRIPDGTRIEAGKYFVFYEQSFGGATGVPFVLNSAHGDEVILSQADALGHLTGYRSQVRFGATANGVSMGTYATTAGVELTALNARTFGADNPSDLAQFRTGAGAANAGPRIGPLVVSEVLYRFLVDGVEDEESEFIELENVTALPVPLYDPQSPTNTWRLKDAVEFEFPSGASLAARARLVVVGFDPADAVKSTAFRARFSMPLEVPLFGPWTGKLGNDGNSIELDRPDPVQLPPHPDAGFVPRILVDRVRYSPLPPWPSLASNGTNSLQRLNLAAYGNEPVNWTSGEPGPGRPRAGVADADGDGLPDSWETANFGSLVRDGTGDLDGDGLSDLQEYLAGTSPADPAESLRVGAITVGAGVILRFHGVAGHTYAVERRNEIESSPWETVARVAAPANSGPIEVVVELGPLEAGRFYRIATPAP